MGFFQRIGNAMARFMYGRNGADQLGMATLVVGIVLDVVSMFAKTDTARRILGIITAVLLFVMLFRMFSRNLTKRRAENAWFLNKILYPVQRKFTATRQRAQDKEHKYFTCPNCKTVCRVPKGKGKIVITCPKCRGEIRGKS